METENNNEGYIYIMFNEMFNYYGPDTVKIGKSIDVAKRMNGYTTSYVKPTELKFISQLCKNYTMAENAIFKQLHNFRMARNREFFRGDISLFIDTIDTIVNNINNDVLTTNEPPPSNVSTPNPVGAKVAPTQLKIAMFRQLQSKLNIDPFDIDLKIVQDMHADTRCDALITDDEYKAIQTRFRTELRKPTNMYEYNKLYIYLLRHLTSKHIWNINRGPPKHGRGYIYSINTELLQKYIHIFSDG